MYDLKIPNVLSDWDNILPFERQIYIDQLLTRLDEQQKEKNTPYGEYANYPTG